MAHKTKLEIHKVFLRFVCFPYDKISHRPQTVFRLMHILMIGVSEKVLVVLLGCVICLVKKSRPVSTKINLCGNTLECM